MDITLAIEYLKGVIPAKARIQKNAGWQIKSGMTKSGHYFAGLII